MTETSEDFHGSRVVAWENGAPVTQAEHDARSGGAKSVVEQPGVDLLGPPSADAVAATQAPSGSVDEVPANASDVVAWIKEGGEVSDDEGARRAGLAWTVESNRGEGNVRSTVEAAVDEYLVPAEPESGEPAGENVPAEPNEGQTPG